MNTGYKSKYEKSKFLKFLCAESGIHFNIKGRKNEKKIGY